MKRERADKNQRHENQKAEREIRFDEAAHRMLITTK